MPLNKLIGKAGTITWGAASINWTKISPKVNRQMGDTTDSTSYDAATDMLWQTQLPAKLGLEYSIAGWYDTVLTPAAFVTVALTGAAAANLLFTLKSGVVFGHGLFDISAFEMEDPVDNTVTFTATLQSNGVFTYGS